MRALVVVGLAVALVACDQQDRTPSPSPAPSASPAAAAPSASVPKAPEAPWYVGKWSGSYDAKSYVVETKKGEALRSWADQDAATEATGAGKLALDVAADGTIGGTASGPLGEMVASGAMDEDSFRVQLSPKDASETSFQGFLVAKREGDAVKGKLQASSGDSLKVRDAPVELTKAK